MSHKIGKLVFFLRFNLILIQLSDGTCLQCLRICFSRAKVHADSLVSRS